VESAASNNPIQTELIDGVLIVRVNRRENRSSLCIVTCGDLAQELVRADGDPDVKVVLLRGCDDFFTAGSDVVDFVNFPLLSLLPPALSFLDALSHSVKPVFAAVNGGAALVGTIMMLRCDLVYTANTVILQMPFVSLGVCSEAGVAMSLPTGQQNASELLLLWEPSTAARTERPGFVTAVVPYAGLIKSVRSKVPNDLHLPPPTYLPESYTESSGVDIQSAA